MGNRNKSHKIQTRFQGVRYYEHPTRNHKGKPDRYFSIRYMVDGKQYEECVGWWSEGMTAAEASQMRSELKKAHRTGEGPTTLKEKKAIRKAEKLKTARDKIRKRRENITFDEVWTKYYPHQKENVTQWSWKREKSLHKLWISPVIGDLPMKSINAVNLQRIKSNMDKKGLSARSICYAMDLIRQVFNYSNNTGLTSIPSPTKGVKKPKKDNKRHRFLSPEEADQLLSALKKHSQNLYEMALISLHCGLRAGEIFSLRWSDVDLDNNRLIIRDTKGGQNRFQPLTNQVKSIFNDKPESNNGDLVYPDRHGKQRKAISKVYFQTVDEIGLNEGIIDQRDKVVFHTLRHTYASWLVQRGVSIYEVSKLLGHSTIIMTERYSHLAPSNYENSVKVIESMQEISYNDSSTFNIKENGIKGKLNDRIREAKKA